MATETGPDLSAAKEAIEALMDDTCLITRDPAGEADSAFDPETGDLTTPVGQPILVYEGQCKLSKTKVQMKYSQEAGRAVPVQSYSGGIPLESGLPQEGDALLVTSSRRDPELAGREFRIAEVTLSSWAVQRRFDLERRDNQAAQDPAESEDASLLLTEDWETLEVESEDPLGLLAEDGALLEVRS